MDSFHTAPKHEKEDDKSSSVDLAIFEKVSTSIQMFSIFITSLMISN
jgi:hypothetical protein